MPSANGHGPKRAILYARVSTEEQVKSGYSLPQQLEALRQFAASEGYEVLEEVADPGRSGAYLERPGLDRVRDLVEAGGVAVVLAQDADRITRDPGHRALLDQEAERHGASFSALDDWGDDSHEGELLRYMKGWVSKGERLKTAERVRRGKQAKARKGEVVGSHKTAYGFRGAEDGEGRTRAYTVEPGQMAVVRRIFRMVGVEGYPLRGVKKNLEAAGIPAPGGGRYWSQGYLRSLVYNDTYKPHSPGELAELLAPEVLRGLDDGASYGMMYYGRQKVTKTPSRENPGGYSYATTIRNREEWTAVPVPDSGIPREWVEAAREAIKDNRRPSAAGDRFWELSGGMIRCSGCGRNLQTTGIKGRNGKTHHYYRCPTKVQHGRDACPDGGYYRADVVEPLVWEEVSGLLKDPARIAEGFEELIEKQRRRGDPGEEAALWRGKLEEANSRRAHRLRQHEKGHITDSELDEALAAIAEERRVAESELGKLQNAAEELAGLEAERETLMASYADMTPEALDNLEPEERHETYRMLRLSVVAHPGGELQASGVLGAGVSNRDSTDTRVA
jgi:site-specific DNA recombinase